MRTVSSCESLDSCFYQKHISMRSCRALWDSESLVDSVTFTVARSQSIWTFWISLNETFAHDCAADTSAASAQCRLVYMGQDLRDFPAPQWIHVTKNVGYSTRCSLFNKLTTHCIVWHQKSLHHVRAVCPISKIMWIVNTKKKEAWGKKRKKKKVRPLKTWEIAVLKAATGHSSTCVSSTEVDRIVTFIGEMSLKGTNTDGDRKK